ncbi:hypothetical protein JNJ66_03770 [Candidatus Saccharibacteria bacterium]|nr:hypothetical protein [Candidatus Saccharibacteria bacterium]
MKKFEVPSFRRSTAVVIAAAGLVLLGGVTVKAVPTSDLTQTINPGTLVTNILDGSRVSVPSPTFAMSAKSLSLDCQTGGNASTGTFGSASQRVYVTNGDAADNGFTLTVAATSGVTSTWANGGATSRIDFNDVTGSTAGCADGADTDTVAGQLTIDPSVSTLVTDCASCTATGVTKGASASFAQGTVDSITLLNAGPTSNDVWRGYLTGAGLSQTIPAETASDSYTLNLTLTATAQ